MSSTREQVLAVVRRHLADTLEGIEGKEPDGVREVECTRRPLTPGLRAPDGI